MREARVEELRVEPHMSGTGGQATCNLNREVLLPLAMI
jgi:hypothetical protein